MKKQLACILLLVSFHFQAQNTFKFKPFQYEDSYQVYLDLTALEDDKLPVQIVPPIVSMDSVEFQMPKIVPGTYDVHNYGRFVNDFLALGPEGEKLEVKRLDKNRWRIYQAFDLYKITYHVDDTYDYAEETDIFEPAGTSVDDSVFLLNNFGFIGYLKEYEDIQFTLKVKKPEGFYGSSALSAVNENGLDVFTTKNYFDLHDNPILYCVPDTASMMVGGAKVLVSVFSKLGLVNAKKSLEQISEVLNAAAVYLGGTLPVEKYAVLIYCADPEKMGAGYGALEHHKSTVLYMPEVDDDFFYNGVRDITAHEFFHIITPLNIHSEQIHKFDFIAPEMSEHIWFYEGVTEYNSILVQVRNGIISTDEFLDQMHDKMVEAEGYNTNIPLTMSSKFTLEFLKKEYSNFYQKGALSGLALDLKLRSLSEGKYGLPQLLKELGDTYGADTFFVDKNFFDIITELTYPEMREFFALHYEATVPFPLFELFQLVGVTYLPEEYFERFSYGNVGFSYNPETERLVIEEVDNMDVFGIDMGYEQGDEVLTFNGDSLNLGTLQLVMNNFFSTTSEGDKITVEVARPKSNGEFKTKKLKAKAIRVPDMRKHVLKVKEIASPEAKSNMKQWINQ